MQETLSQPLTVSLIDLNKIDLSKTNPRKTINDDTISQLADDIIKNGGVKIPIKVRKTKTDSVMLYEVVYGERRVRASLKAGLISIPGFIVEMTDEEAEFEQFVENMNREDVHPLDEGLRFVEMQNAGKSKEDIAVLINRPINYVAMRMELGNLLPAYHKDFKENKMPVSIALNLARLPEEAQKKLKNDLTHSDSVYISLKELKKIIAEEINSELGKAVFDITDPLLFKKAGSCTECSKRTGAGMLFPEIGKKDFCLERSCFEQKTMLHTVSKVQEVIELQPDVILVKNSYSEIPAPVQKIIEKNDVKVTNYYSLNTTTKANGTPCKIMYVSKENLGSITTVYLQKSDKKPKLDIKKLKNAEVAPEVVNNAITDSIDAINARMIRAVELDENKIWTAVKDQILNADVEIVDKALNEREIVFFLLAMFEASSDKGWILDLLNVKGNRYEYEDAELTAAFRCITPSRFNIIQRKFIMDILNKNEWSHNPDRRCANLLYQYLCMQPGISDAIKDIEFKQNTEAEQRIARADERISELKKQKVEVLESEKPAKTSKKSAKKHKNAQGSNIIEEDDYSEPEEEDEDFPVDEED
jgi:ParB/RepB/Spo0J family partition protein